MIVKLPPRTWVDLYAAVGASAGDLLRVTLVASNDVRLSWVAGTPTALDDYIMLNQYHPAAINEATDLGAWAMGAGNSAILVEEL